VSGHDPVLRQHGYHSLRIARVVPETHDASSFVLGDEHLRSYSMSSAPATDSELTVTVKRVAGGLVSNWFLDNLSEGDAIELTKPAGVFCPQESEGPVLGFCGGSGITPVMSITKHVLATTERPVRLLYANRDPNSVIFDAALAALGAEHPGRLEVRRHFDTDEGFLTAEAIAQFVAADLDADIYICGPGPFMDLVETTVLTQGVAPERIFIERFLVEQAEKTDVLIDEEATPAVGTVVPDEVTVTLGGKTVVVRYQPGDTLLETARRGGLRPPFSCEAGNCATCMAFLKEGSVRMRANNALTPEEVEEGWVLTCQSLPSGRTVIVEYEAL
jgi:3-ketosteroid 9alpha-monooxygenase subunit B